MAFAALMPKHGDQQKMAERLSLTQDQVSRWATGDRRPDTEARATLEQKLGIGWREWDLPPDGEEEATEEEPTDPFRGDRVA